MARKSSGNHRQPTIKAITVRGFKSIHGSQRIEIRPLTVLAGANSSGKSSIMQPVLLLKQTLESPFDPGALLLDGPNVRITSADQMLPKTASGREPRGSFSVDFEIAGDDRVALDFKAVPARGVQLESMRFRLGKGPERRFYPGMPQHEILHVLPKPLSDSCKRQAEPADLAVVRDRCFLSVGRSDRDYPLVYLPHTLLLGQLLMGLIHVPGLRGNPERFYRITAVGTSFPGTFESYVASVVSQWQAKKETDRLRALSEALEHLGLTWKVSARPIEDTRVELRVGRLPHARRGGAGDLVSVADVGFGVSQTLPVVVALLVAGSGDTVYLEQPEIHLHPSAQARMAKLLADAATRGVRVIAETHSSLLLRGIQTLVAEGVLAPDRLKLHWFQRDPETGFTQITSADLDKDGAFGDWPSDFDEVMLETERHYLDAVESRSAHS